PIPTTFKFTKSKNYSLVGKTLEIPKAESAFDELFGMQVGWFDQTATFKQEIKILSKEDFKLKGSVEYMACNDRQCIPPEELEISFDVKGYSKITENSETIVNTVESEDTTQIITTSNLAKSDTSISSKETSIKSNKDESSSMWGIFFQGFLFGFV